MNIVRIPILTVAHPDDPHPWYVMTVEDDGVTITEANHSGGQSKAVAKRILFSDIAAMVYGGSIGVTLDDDIAMFPYQDPETATPSKGSALIWQAHLGEYIPATDTLTLLEFIDKVTGEKTMADVVKTSLLLDALAEAAGREVEIDEVNAMKASGKMVVQDNG